MHTNNTLNNKLQFSVPNLMTVKQFTKNFSAFSTGAIRNYIFFEDTNGLKEKRVIKRIGRKILIDVDKFFQWIESQNQGGSR